VLCHDPATATVDGLQDRVHATVSYALDRQLAETFPDVAGRQSVFALTHQRATSI
jgi:hypothetical protein